MLRMAIGGTASSSGSSLSANRQASAMLGMLDRVVGAGGSVPVCELETSWDTWRRHLRLGHSYVTCMGFPSPDSLGRPSECTMTLEVMPNRGERSGVIPSAARRPPLLRVSAGWVVFGGECCYRLDSGPYVAVEASQGLVAALGFEQRRADTCFAEVGKCGVAVIVARLVAGSRSLMSRDRISLARAAVS